LRRNQRRENLVSDLIAIAYPDLATAQQVVSNLADAQKAHLIELDDLALVEHREDGKIKLHQASLAASGAAGGALWGGLFGMLFLAPFVGMAIGAASGGAAGAAADTGVDDKFMKDLGAKLQPGGAALIVLVREMNVEKVLGEIHVHGEVVQTSLGNDDENALREALAGVA
jgi:uncharacterized membrane protein